MLLQQPDVKSLYALAAASYYNHDLKTAYAAITKAVNLAPENPFVLKAASMIAAALNQPLEVQNFRNKYVAANKKADGYLDRRLHQWMNVHNNPNLILTAASSDDDSNDDEGDDDSAADTSGDAASADPLAGVGGGTAATPIAKKLGAYNAKNPDTFVVDCAIMRVSEQGKTSKGTNILNSINVVFNTGTYTSTRTWRNMPGQSPTGSTSKSFNQGFGLSQAAGAAYSLNIF